MKYIMPREAFPVDDLKQLTDDLYDCIHFRHRCKGVLDIPFSDLMRQAEALGDQYAVNVIRNFHALAIIHEMLFTLPKVPAELAGFFGSISRAAIYDAELPAVLIGRLQMALKEKELPWKSFATVRGLYKKIGFSSRVIPEQALKLYQQFAAGEGVMLSAVFTAANQKIIIRRMRHFLQELAESMDDRGHCSGLVAMAMMARASFAQFKLHRRVMSFFQDHEIRQLSVFAVAYDKYRKAKVADRVGMLTDQVVVQAKQAYEFIASLIFAHNPRRLGENRADWHHHDMARYFKVMRPCYVSYDCVERFKVTFKKKPVGDLIAWLQQPRVLQSHAQYRLSIHRDIGGIVHRHAMYLYRTQDGRVVLSDSNSKCGDVVLDKLDDIATSLARYKIDVADKAEITVKVFEFSDVDAKASAALEAACRFATNRLGLGGGELKKGESDDVDGGACLLRYRVFNALHSDSTPPTVGCVGPVKARYDVVMS